MPSFRNRLVAGQLLSKKLTSLKKEKPIVLALPRGGVPVAAEIARELQAPLDILMVKKIGMPGYSELALGAVSEDEQPFLHHERIAKYQVDREQLEQVAWQKIREVQEQTRILRSSKPAIDLKNRIVILVDDGVATGATTEAAVQLLRKKGVKKIVLAVPVAPASSIDQLRQLVDEVVMLLTPEPFYSVGQWYEDFTQVTDTDVREIIAASANIHIENLTIQDGSAVLRARLTTPQNMKALVIFAHGSGSSYSSPRNIFVADAFSQQGFATLLFDLLTPEEAIEKENVFDIGLLSRRLQVATDWAAERFQDTQPPLAYFGASTGAAAALSAAAKGKHSVFAVISRGGRPDLAQASLRDIDVPILLIVGGEDKAVIELNQKTWEQLPQAEMINVSGATHVFSEPGALERVTNLSVGWLRGQLKTLSTRSGANYQPQFESQGRELTETWIMRP